MGVQIAAPGSRITVDPRVEWRLSAAGRLVRWAAVGYALIGLLGLSIPFFGEIPPGPASVRDMPFASAVSLATMASGALLAGENVGRGWRRLGLALSLLAAGAGVTVMAVFFSNRNDLWDVVGPPPAFSVGVMVTLLGVSVPLSLSRRESRVIAGQVASLLVFSVAAVIFLGYTYGDPSLGRLFVQPEISFQASLLAVVIATGVLLMRPAAGLLSMAASPGVGGRVLRWLGPVVLFTPAVLLLVSEAVPSTDRVDVLAFISVGLGLLLLILLGVFVRALDMTGVEAATMAAEAERARIGLQQEAPVVTRVAEILHLVEVADAKGIEVATRFRPGRGRVAGDASAVHGLPDGSVGAVLVDVTGHGADPSLWAIRVRDLLLQSLIAGRTPEEAMTLVEWSAPGDMLASAVVVRLDPSKGTGHLCSAGHPPAIVVSGHRAELKPATGPLLYLSSETPFEQHELDLGLGDSLVLFSDGVADVQVLRGGRSEPEILADLLSEGGMAGRLADLVLGFASPEPNDDQTVVIIRRA